MAKRHSNSIHTLHALGRKLAGNLKPRGETAIGRRFLYKLTDELCNAILAFSNDSLGWRRPFIVMTAPRAWVMLDPKQFNWKHEGEPSIKLSATYLEPLPILTAVGMQAYCL
jgi:hypothetical protein